MVFGTGETARRKKTAAITVPQMRAIFSRLLRTPMPSPQQIAEVVTRVLQRNEEARIYHWIKATGTFPPPRHDDS
jgi:hypothetical protein